MFRALWSTIISCYSILFSNLKQKKNTILLVVVISSHVGPMYSETYCVYQLYLLLDIPLISLIMAVYDDTDAFVYEKVKNFC